MPILQASRAIRRTR